MATTPGWFGSPAAPQTVHATTPTPTTTSRLDQERVLRRAADDRAAHEAQASAAALAPALRHPRIAAFLQRYREGAERAAALRLALLHGILSLTGPEEEEEGEEQGAPPIDVLRGRVAKAAAAGAVVGASLVPKVQRALLDLQQRLDQAYAALDGGGGGDNGRPPPPPPRQQQPVPVPRPPPPQQQQQQQPVARLPVQSATVRKTRATDNQGATFPVYPDWWGDGGGEGGGGGGVGSAVAAADDDEVEQQQHQHHHVLAAEPAAPRLASTTTKGGKYVQPSATPTPKMTRIKQQKRTAATLLLRRPRGGGGTGRSRISGAQAEQGPLLFPAAVGTPPAVAATVARLAADPWASWFIGGGGGGGGGRGGAATEAAAAAAAAVVDDDKQRPLPTTAAAPTSPRKPTTTAAPTPWQADFGHLDAPSLESAVRELRAVEERHRRRLLGGGGGVDGTRAASPPPGVRPEAVEASRGWVGEFKRDMVDAAAAAARERFLMAAAEAAAAAAAGPAGGLMSPEQLQRLVCDDDDEEKDEEDDGSSESSSTSKSSNGRSSSDTNDDEDGARISALLREIELAVQREAEGDARLLFILHISTNNMAQQAGGGGGGDIFWATYLEAPVLLRLLSCGASADVQGSGGATTLMHACAAGERTARVTVPALRASSRETRRAVNRNGFSAIDRLVDRGHSSKDWCQDVIGVLLSSGAPVKPENASLVLPIAARHATRLERGVAAHENEPPPWQVHEAMVELAHDFQDARAADEGVRVRERRVRELEEALRARRGGTEDTDESDEGEEGGSGSG